MKSEKKECHNRDWTSGLFFVKKLTNMVASRTVSADPGLLSPEELLASHKGGRRRTLEQLIAEQRAKELLKDHKNEYFSRCREYVRWFLDNAHLKISVRITLATHTISDGRTKWHERSDLFLSSFYAV